MDAKKLIGNGLRVLITNRCNYSCFFCHSEGIDPKAELQERIDPALIADFVREGAKDLTISGGEPMMAFSPLLELLKGIRSNLSPSELSALSLTVVSNAALLKKERMLRLRDETVGFAGLRFNISLHSPDPTVYDKVTGTVSMYSLVTSNIRTAVDMGFDVSLNFVLLRGYNEKELDQIMRFSSSVGVKRIKIIEFLVTNTNKNFYSSFHRLDSLIYNNRHRASFTTSESRRKTRHRYPEYDITVDYTKCTCALGCDNCLNTREIEITPDNRLLGCIALPPIQITPGETAVQLADKAVEQINSMKALYGSYSPSMVFAPKNVYGMGRFTVAADNSVTDLFSKKSIISTHREYRQYYLGRPSGSEYFFLLIESDEDTHSKLVCYKHGRKTGNGLSWEERDYLDHVYEFSRTRQEINRKKVLAMGLKLPEPVRTVEDSVVLRDKASENMAILRYLNENGTYRLVLDVLREKSDSWSKGEPAESAVRLAKSFEFRLASQD